MSEIFEVEISCKGKGGASTTLKLPATLFEIADALEKARITDSTTTYQSEILSCELDYPSQPQLVLRRLISEDANLYELNHLAQRLNVMSDWELDCFEGMTIMDAVKKDYTPLPLERLINMTHSTADCQIAYETLDDKSLGKFYVDNGMSDIPGNLPEILYEILDYEAIGRKARTSEGGVFTEKGYVCAYALKSAGEMAQIYCEGSAVPREKPSHTIMLEVCKGFFDNPDRPDNGNGYSEFPMLPADDGMIGRVLGQLDAASAEECSFRAVDCIVPNLTELISDSLYESEGDCYGAVNELAEQLKRLDVEGKLVTYKAMVEAAPDDLTLEEAIDLAQQAADFSVRREMISPPDYAKAVLAKCDIPLRDELIAEADLWHYGGKLMAQDLAITTGYGILCADDGMTVEQCLGRPDHSYSMEMR